MPSKFQFIFGAEKNLPAAGDFVLHLPSGIQDKANLFSHYAKAGRFPAYFGNNWDALSDCLRDFSWIAEKRILIVHDGLPLQGNEKELLTYLEILDAAQKLWKKHLQHELLVVFPRESEATIARLVSP